MSLGYSYHIQSFQEILDEMESDLRSYALKPEANAFAIEVRNRKLKKLNDIFNGLNIPTLDIWIALIEEMNRLRLADPHLAGFHIEILEKPTGGMARISANLIVS